MTVKQEIEIAKDIYNEKIEVEDKMIAIQDIVELDQIPRRITKEDLMEIIRWLVEEYI